MNNDAFTKLVSSNGKFDAKAAINEFDKSSNKRKHGNNGNNEQDGEDNEDGDGKRKEKKRYRKGKLVTDKDDDDGNPNSNTKYRDRAAERREMGVTSEYVETQKLVQRYEDSRGEGSVIGGVGGEGEDMTRFLGGDEEHTHLVRGLDKALADRVRGEMEGKGGKVDEGAEEGYNDLDRLDEAFVNVGKSRNKGKVRKGEVVKLLSSYKGGIEVCDGVVRWLKSTYGIVESKRDEKQDADQGGGGKVGGTNNEGWVVMELGRDMGWGGVGWVSRKKRPSGRVKKNDGWRKVRSDVIEVVRVGMERAKVAEEEGGKGKEGKKEKKNEEKGEGEGEGEEAKKMEPVDNDNDNNDNDDDIYSDVEEEYAPQDVVEVAKKDDANQPRRRKVGFADDVTEESRGGGAGGIFDGLDSGVEPVEEPVEGGGLVLPKMEFGGEDEEGGEEGKSRRERRKGGKIERDMLGIGKGKGRKKKGANDGVSWKGDGTYGEDMDDDFEWREEDMEDEGAEEEGGKGGKVRPSEERSNEQTTQSQAAKIPCAHTSIQYSLPTYHRNNSHPSPQSFSRFSSRRRKGRRRLRCNKFSIKNSTRFLPLPPSLTPLLLRNLHDLPPPDK